MAFNPLHHPVALTVPRRISANSAWIQHIPFAMTWVDLARPRTIVELGCYWGDSYCAFCQAVAELQLPTRCVAVDTWEGDAHLGPYHGVYENLREHHDPLYASFSALWRMRFDEAAARTQDNSVDLLHIDGLHFYEAVRSDFETWLPKMSDRGIMLFHDTVVQGAGFGVMQLWAELAKRYPAFEFRHGSGLGVLGVGSALPQPVRQFFETAAARPDVVRRHFQQYGQALSWQRTALLMLEQAESTYAVLRERLERSGESPTGSPDPPDFARRDPARFAAHVTQLARRVCDVAQTRSNSQSPG